MKIQYALDVFTAHDALTMAEIAVDAGISCLEAGHVLVKSSGVSVVSDLRRHFPGVEIVADMKTMDMGSDEVRIAADAGADLVIVCGAASNGTVTSAMDEAARNGIGVLVSLMGVQDRVSRTRQLVDIGVTCVIAHRGIDDNFLWTDAGPATDLEELLALEKLEVALAGGITASSMSLFIDMRFERVIVGRGITGAHDPAAAAKLLANTAAMAQRGRPL